MARLYSKRELPPCPDPEKYILVKMGNMFYWRRKRGSVKKAVLNEVFRANANNTALTNKAAMEIIGKLSPFLENLLKDRRLANISGRLKKGLNANGKLDYTFLKGFELQRDYPLKSMLKTAVQFSVTNDMAVVSFHLNQWTVKPLNRLVTQYSFEIILLSGELPGEKRLRIDTESSRWFGFDERPDEELILSLLLPENLPWMLILKLSCMEGRERALHPKHHVMQVIGTGTGRISQSERRLL